MRTVIEFRGARESLKALGSVEPISISFTEEMNGHGNWSAQLREPVNFEGLDSVLACIHFLDDVGGKDFMFQGWVARSYRQLGGALNIEGPGAGAYLAKRLVHTTRGSAAEDTGKLIALILADTLNTPDGRPSLWTTDGAAQTSGDIEPVAYSSLDDVYVWDAIQNAASLGNGLQVYPDFYYNAQGNSAVNWKWTGLNDSITDHGLSIVDTDNLLDLTVQSSSADMYNSLKATSNGMVYPLDVGSHQSENLLIERSNSYEADTLQQLGNRGTWDIVAAVDSQVTASAVVPLFQPSYDCRLWKVGDNAKLSTTMLPTIIQDRTMKISRRTITVGPARGSCSLELIDQVGL